MPTIVSAVQHSIRNWLRLIGVDFGGQPECAPLTIEQRPCIYQFLPYFPPTKFGFSPQYFSQVYANAQAANQNVMTVFLVLFTLFSSVLSNLLDTTSSLRS